MNPISIITNLLATPWPQLPITPPVDGFQTIDIDAMGDVQGIGRIPNATASGKSAVIIGVSTPQGLQFARTTFALFKSAAQVLNVVDAIESKRQPHASDTKESEAVEQLPNIRFRLAPLMTAVGPTCYIKTEGKGETMKIAPLHSAFNSAELRAIADDMDRRQGYITKPD